MRNSGNSQLIEARGPEGPRIDMTLFAVDRLIFVPPAGIGGMSFLYKLTSIRHREYHFFLRGGHLQIQRDMIPNNMEKKTIISPDIIRFIEKANR